MLRLHCIKTKQHGKEVIFGEFTESCKIQISDKVQINHFRIINIPHRSHDLLGREMLLLHVR